MSDVVEIPVEFQFVRESWRDRAACDGCDPNMFHPNRGEPTEPAKLVCWGCPVKTECLTWALDHFVKLGIYGGRSERERRRMRRERRQAARRGEVYVIRPINEEPVLPAYFTVRLRPRRLPVARFDGHRIVRTRSVIVAPRRHRVARFEDLAAA